MKPKHALAIAGALLIGAAANVLVSWWCAVHPQTEVWTRIASEKLATTWFVTSVAEYSGCSRCVGALAGNEADARLLTEMAIAQNVSPHGNSLTDAQAPTWALSPAILSKANLGTPAHFESVASGWPMFAMVYHEAPASVAMGPMQRGLPYKNPKLYRQRRLALLPIWPGFAVNTTLYALPWLAAWWGINRTRKWLRQRRGGCPGCAYDRRGLPPDAPCPECGLIPVATS